MAAACRIPDCEHDATEGVWCGPHSREFGGRTPASVWIRRGETQAQVAARCTVFLEQIINSTPAPTVPAPRPAPPPKRKLAVVKLRRPSSRIVVKKGPAGPWWVIVAANGQVRATSEVFSSMQHAMTSASEYAKDVGLRVEVEVDLT